MSRWYLELADQQGQLETAYVDASVSLVSFALQSSYCKERRGRERDRERQKREREVCMIGRSEREREAGRSVREREKCV